MVDWHKLADTLTARFGIELSVSDTSEKSGLLRVEGIDPPNGFGIEIAIGWRSIEARFKPDTFASALMNTIKLSSARQHDEFSILAGSYVQHGLNIQMKISGSNVDVQALPPGSIDRFELQCSQFSDRSDDYAGAMETGSACLALVLTLLPLETEGDEIGITDGEAEGGMSRIEINKYERSPSNRAAAIAFHGTLCHACKFDFAQRYGEWGEGYIEIHHKIMVSKMGTDYIVNPSSDLVPLCANCHRMVHRTNPPLDIDALIAIIR